MLDWMRTNNMKIKGLRIIWKIPKANLHSHVATGLQRFSCQHLWSLPLPHFYMLHTIHRRTHFHRPPKCWTQPPKLDWQVLTNQYASSSDIAMDVVFTMQILLWFRRRCIRTTINNNFIECCKSYRPWSMHTRVKGTIWFIKSSVYSVKIR